MLLEPRRLGDWRRLGDCRLGDWDLGDWAVDAEDVGGVLVLVHALGQRLLPVLVAPVLQMSRNSL